MYICQEYREATTKEGKSLLLRKQTRVNRKTYCCYTRVYIKPQRIHQLQIRSSGETTGGGSGGI